MGLNVPVSVSVTRVVILGAGNFDLSETPLRKVDIAGAKVATHNWVLETESGRQGADPASVTRGNIPYDLNLPVVLVVANSEIAVARNLLVRFGNRSRDLVRVKVTARLSVDQADSLAITNESGLCILIIVGIATVGVEEPIIVSILVVVASNLLLSRTLRIGLHMRM